MTAVPPRFTPPLGCGYLNAPQNRISCAWAATAVLALLVVSAALPARAQTCSGMSLGNGASLNGFVPFPATNVWNTNIAAAAVDPNSTAITAAAGFAGLHLHPDFGSEAYYGIPYVVVDSSTQPNVPVNVIDYADESDVVLAPYPVTAPVEGLPADCSGWPDTYVGDSHVLVLDRAKCELYETFSTHRCNGQWTSASETIWDMSNYESRPWGWTSADAAGLPIFPGLIRYDEVASGAIHHAIRFTMEHTKNDQNDGYFVMPASHAAGTDYGVSNVMGMRIRLKASYDISGYSAINQVILKAMQQYGMILADNGGYFFFQGASDPRWSDDDLANLEGVGSENFDVVQASPEFPGWDSNSAPTGALPTISSFNASAASVTSGSPVTFTYSAKGDSYDFIDTIGPVKAGSGSVTVNPTQTQTYTLNSTNAFGRTASTPITVTVAGSVVAADGEHQLRDITQCDHPLHHERRHADDRFAGLFNRQPNHSLEHSEAAGDRGGEWLCGCLRCGVGHLHLCGASFRACLFTQGGNLPGARVADAERCNGGRDDLLHHQRDHSIDQFNEIHRSLCRYRQRDCRGHRGCFWIQQQPGRLGRLQPHRLTRRFGRPGKRGDLHRGYPERGGECARACRFV